VLYDGSVSFVQVHPVQLVQIRLHFSANFLSQGWGWMERIRVTVQLDGESR
jgi:hypothetical protein